ncbi:hypothetical protein Achl_4132 (plasmid) [Pseudarthrobacter chlorophenolicus A6]|uniref:Uncharacterized protein n=1 Tax=Pseudarthrobacter chlorophenolicus (strain ATCC 700700 / DSM 12829 / CIP 107037 / JCM 12360 / KCTC 9906 / NCIMB 13794 / A6) TaxID=452863 RepID=B8HI36_PSECP|nr:hypothetical protein [Pseudarthrobacter chlorophenolicus]ACL42083.1 hypothetical protein Achl_4132 [Pseudarthrobacter chlorophenolicus A6]SDQ13192.1 hypothetical protein SAMN04489738_0191 [Pseudarthrobacter chlorophenolicus]SDQ21354.1 hypothetical protein SAMN04489738_0783 [Pseudarthrobacter chlorophenolicus]
MTTVYTLDLGYSPEGGSVHPVDRVRTLQSLDAAKVAAEQEAGKQLRWRWMEDRRVWRAEVGYQRAAEISEGTRVERIDVEVCLMS